MEKQTNPSNKAFWKSFELHFSGLALGGHTFLYELDQSFFEQFAPPPWSDCHLQSTLHVEKHTSSLGLQLTVEGNVLIPCDLTDIPYWQPLCGHWNGVIKFAHPPLPENDDEVLYLPHGENQIQIAQYLYETAILNLPSKCINPEDSPEKRAALERLEQLAPKISENTDWWKPLQTLREG